MSMLMTMTFDIYAFSFEKGETISKNNIKRSVKTEDYIYSRTVHTGTSTVRPRKPSRVRARTKISVRSPTVLCTSQRAFAYRFRAVPSCLCVRLPFPTVRTSFVGCARLPLHTVIRTKPIILDGFEELVVSHVHTRTGTTP
jgi:hypothetical protein